MTEFKNQSKQLQSHAGHIPHQLKAAAVLQDNRNQAGAAPVITDNRPAQLATKPNNTGLPNQLKAGIESLSGMSMDHVKVHYNSSQPAQLNAHAYAQGSEIHVAPGQEKHLPHEAWHVVQQAQGRVKPTVQMKGNIKVNDDDVLEKEADVMGEKATQSKLATIDSLSHNYARSSSQIQRSIIMDASKNELKKDGDIQLRGKKKGKQKRRQKKIEKGIAYRERSEQKLKNRVLPEYESLTEEPENVENNPREFYDTVNQKVREILNGVAYRVGGSSAAKMHGAARHPQDLDLEFWTYEEALEASKMLTAYRHEDGNQELYELYFLVNEEEENVSVTVSSVVVKVKGELRRPGPTIELNNENYRMSDEDYRALPNTRMGNPNQAGGLVRRGSLIAGSLLRYTTYKTLGKPDLKQDIPLIRTLLKTEGEGVLPLRDIFSKIDMVRLKTEQPEIFAMLKRVAHMESLRAGDMSIENVNEALKDKVEPFREMIGARTEEVEMTDTDSEISEESE